MRMTGLLSFFCTQPPICRRGLSCLYTPFTYNIIIFSWWKTPASLPSRARGPGSSPTSCFGLICGLSNLFLTLSLPTLITTSMMLFVVVPRSSSGSDVSGERGRRIPCCPPRWLTLHRCAHGIIRSHLPCKAPAGLRGVPTPSSPCFSLTLGLS